MEVNTGGDKMNYMSALGRPSVAGDCGVNDKGSAIVEITCNSVSFELGTGK